MKVTKRQLRRIIKEEFTRILSEQIQPGDAVNTVEDFENLTPGTKISLFGIKPNLPDGTEVRFVAILKDSTTLVFIDSNDIYDRFDYGRYVGPDSENVKYVGPGKL